MTDAQIRVRLRAGRDARSFAPRDATPDLKAAELAREHARQDAVIAEREADLVGDPDQAAALREAAAALRGEEALRATAAQDHARAVQERTSWAETWGPTLDQADLVHGEAEARGITLDGEPDRRTAREHLADETPEARTDVRTSAADGPDDDAHRVITEDDVLDDQAEDVDVDPAELDTLPEVPLLGSDAARTALEAECTFAARAAEARSQDAHEPLDTDAARHHRWVLDEAAAAAAGDATGADTYDAA
jgi:hypothetical protein